MTGNNPISLGFDRVPFGLQSAPVPSPAARRWLFVSALFATALFGCGSRDPWAGVNLTPKQQEMIAQIKSKGGSVELDEKSPGDPAFVVALKSSNTNDDDVLAIRELGKIRGLTLDGTNVTNGLLAKLAEWPDVVRLSLSKTSITDAGAAHLAKMTQLQELKLDKTQITDEGVAHLSALTKLQRLNLAQNSLSDASVRHLLPLKELQDLRLWDTQVSDDSKELFLEMKNLREVYLVKTHVTDKTQKWLKEKAPHLIVDRGPQDARPHTKD